MEINLTMISLFAGGGGFELAFEQAGVRVVAQVEIDRNCNCVLAHRFPGVPRFGDIREVDPADLPWANIVCGGVPCQDWSVAGRRAGLAGERSGLFFEFIRIADSLAPDWLVFENVDGLLSAHKGKDFAIVLREITGFWPAVPSGGWRNSGICWGPKRSAAWRVLDAQYFGLAQRRERVFIIGCLGDRAAAAKVLFEPESCSGDSPPGREAGAGAAACFATRPNGSGYPADTSPTIDARAKDGPRRNQGGVMVAQPYIINAAESCAKKSHARESEVARCLDSAGSFATNQGGTVVIQDVRGGTRGKTDHGQGIGIREGGPMYTLGATEQHAVLAFSGGQSAGARSLAIAEELAPPLRGTASGTNQVPTIAHTLTANYGKQADNSDRNGGPPNLIIAHTLRAEGADASEDGTGRGVPLVVSGWRVRKLTPRECERLQGFPDDFTLVPNARGKPMADGPRYKMTGNAVAVACFEWIARRLMAVNTQLRTRG